MLCWSVLMPSDVQFVLHVYLDFRFDMSIACVVYASTCAVLSFTVCLHVCVVYMCEGLGGLCPCLCTCAGVSLLKACLCSVHVCAHVCAGLSVTVSMMSESLVKMY